MKVTDAQLNDALSAYHFDSFASHSEKVRAALESLEGVYLSEDEARQVYAGTTGRTSAGQSARLILDAQLTPPTPEPQKFGAVVRDANGRLYSHDGTTDDIPWKSYDLDGGDWRPWRDIAQPVTIEFEGVDE